MEIPVTKYARSGDVNIAYQVVGEGDEYLIFVPGWISNVEAIWQNFHFAAWIRSLTFFTKVVIFDKRGTGLSDRIDPGNVPDISQRAEDLNQIMDCLKIKKCNILGLSEGGALGLYFTANYPEKVNKLILFGCFSKWIQSDDYPYGLTLEQHKHTMDYLFQHWGGPVGFHLMAPSMVNDDMVKAQWAGFLRQSASPSTARAFYAMNLHIDVRHLLPAIKHATLIIHRREDKLIEKGHSQYLHEQIPTSDLLITEGKDHLPWFQINRQEIHTISTFLLGESPDMATTSTGYKLHIDELMIFYRIRDYLHQYFYMEISLRKLSRRFGINEYKLKSGFKILFDQPVIAYLTQVRINHACKLLINQTSNVQSIAAQVGYGNSNNFSTAFKRITGQSPFQYRKKFLS